MKKSQDWDDIRVNRRSTDKVFFESTFIQRVSDKIDFLKDESKEIIKEMDLKNIDEVNFDELSDSALNRASDVVDDMSKLKSEIINSDDLPDFIRESSNEIKFALNRDEDYVRRARRRLDNLDSDELIDVYKTNIRVIELCDKAIKVSDSNAQAYYLKGVALTNLEKYSEAIEEFITSLSLHDDDLVWLAIGNANRLNKDYDDALSVYDKVLENDNDSFDALKGKAHVYYDMKDFKNADEFFKKADAIEELDDVSQKLWDECRL